MPSPQLNWLDRATAMVAPRWTLQRVRSRLAIDLLHRHYEAASFGRRTENWHRSGGDANAAIGPGLARLREVARDLVRNNPWAESALSTIADDTVGWGIVAKLTPRNERLEELWKSWANTTSCDADGQHDFYGLQKLVMRTMAESGEVLVRRRWRRLEDGFPLPLQLQVLEPDFLDTTKDMPLQNGGEIVQGVEFDALGRRAAYWLFPRHPGASRIVNASLIYGASRRVPASEVLHIFKASRAGQVRAPSWFSPVILRLKDLDEFEDATLMKQKIAACLAVICSDIDGTASPLGTANTTEDPQIDTLEPGAILNVPPGKSVQVVQPPNVRDYPDYTETQQRATATGIGVTYEDLTGDYTDLPFSAARMSRLRQQRRIDDWRWRLLVPRFCDPAFRWAMEAAQVLGVTEQTSVRWSAPPMPMIEPDKEGLAYQRNVRTGIMTLSEAIRERGYDPDELLNEYAADNKKLDELRILLDSDPRRMTQSGQGQAAFLKGAADGEATK